MVYVPAGAFTMGSKHNEKEPAHEVYLDAFWIDIHEVTNRQYSRFVKAADYPFGFRDCLLLGSLAETDGGAQRRGEQQEGESGRRECCALREEDHVGHLRHAHDEETDDRLTS